MSQIETDGSGLSASGGLCHNREVSEATHPCRALHLACSESKSGHTPGGKDKRVSGTAGNICSGRAVDPRLLGPQTHRGEDTGRGSWLQAGAGSEPTAPLTVCALLVHAGQ